MKYSVNFKTSRSNATVSAAPDFSNQATMRLFETCEACNNDFLTRVKGQKTCCTDGTCPRVP